MKRVFLLRHGKTEKESESGMDFDRKLQTKGEQEVAAAVEKLAENGIHTDRILSSTAQRAVSSARIAAGTLGYSIEPDPRGELYQADKEDYLDLLMSLDDTIETVLIVGHNPAIEETVEAFTGKHRKLGTGNIMWLEFDCMSWKELSFEMPVLRSGLIVP